ncbi:hypothetical protein ACFC2F_22055 [Enterobacter sichuanensis]|uniref:hypothetical protein n=1 Tax=Enterobacter TaxID=547 RepID=UPI000F869C54|nr:hypothetical protein [Enterobacter sp. WCHEn090032]RTN96679.1 hypothetical protein EKN83_09700 [Enterobacter sp. WCHEn090032]
MKMKPVYGLFVALALGGCAERSTVTTDPVPPSPEPDFSALTMVCSDGSGTDRMAKMYTKSETVTFDGKTYRFVAPSGETMDTSKMTFRNEAGEQLQFDMSKLGYTPLLRIHAGQQQAFKCQNTQK